ncbi:MAG: translocation/assembly module TamB [Bacteroidota bacterium]|nr:translocation/assembly module TamB [Bacteroidota bacterium]
MSSKEKNIDDNNKTPKKKSFTGRFFKWLLVLFSSLIILILGILFFIQTDLFDKWALGYALDKINSSLTSKDATIYAESLTGNLLKGFELNKVVVKVKEDTLLKVNSISVGYKIKGLLDKEIFVHDLVLKEPQINLTKIRDRNDSLKWNLNYLLESEKIDEDTATSEFEWGITAERIVIENGAVRILEEKNSSLPIREIVMPKLDTFETGKFDMQNLNLILSAKYFPDFKDIDIKSMTFKTNSNFNVNKLNLEADINEKNSITELSNFEVTTDRSDFVINELYMENLNPFDGVDYESFYDNETKINLDSKQFNFADLTFFFPDINFLDSTVGLKLVADGKYGDLNISQLDLQTPNSKYFFGGNVKYLNEPSKIYFNISGQNIEVNGIDTKIILPGLKIPNYSYLGKVYIDHLTYVGEPERFTSDFDIRSTAGNARGKVNFDLTGNVPGYKGDLITNNFNIGRIVQDKSLESSISGEFRFDIRGFDYKTAAGKLNYSLNRTKFYGQNISKSDGQLNFNRGSINLDVSYNSDAVKTKTTGKINISNPKNISYDLKGTASGLNISAFTKDNSQNSNLNFDFDINGNGFNPNSMAGSFKINMNPSTFAEFTIPASPLDIEIGLDGSIKKLSMTSDFADISAEGEFDFNTLSAVLDNNIEKIKSALTSGMNTDSIQSNDPAGNSYAPSCENLSMNYSINIKDMTPLFTLVGIDSLLFAGKLDGSISDSCGMFNFITDGVIDEFRFKDSLIITKDALLKASIKNNITGYEQSQLNADINFSTNKLIVSKFLLDTTFADINFINNENKFLIRTMKDSTLRLFTEGNLQDSLVVNFDSLAFKYQNFLVTNNKNLIVKYNSVDSSQSIEFRQFALNNLEQKLSVQGLYSLTDTSDVKISSGNISLSTYQKLFNKDLDTNNMISGKIRYFDLLYKGTAEFPVLQLDATSEILRFGSTKLGRFDATIKYKDNELTPNVVFYNERNTGSFTLDGNVPMLITFSDEKVDSLQRAQRLADKNVNLNATAKNFQLKVFQQLLPYTADLQGILDGKISLLGTVQKPELIGNMDINKGKFYVTLTKMNYNFFAKVESQEENLVITDSRIFTSEEPSRFISTSGYIDFTGLTLNDINLEMSGNLKAFDKDNGMTELGIAGDLWIGSGRPTIKLKGTTGRFDLTGNLILVKGNITFNPFIQEAYNIYSDDFNYGVIIDSVNTNKETTKSILMESPDSVVILTGLDLNPFDKILYTTGNTELKKVAREKSGQFFYNVYVTTGENVFLKFIVNEKSQQEFFGEIKTDLYVDNKDNGQMSGRGVVNLGDNCYYKFFRKFDASGKATFTGPIANPELSIAAEYKGYATNESAGEGVLNVEDVLIELRVAGRASNPTLTITVDRNGVKEAGSNATSDALSFLLFGKFSDQLSFSESSSFGANLGASFLSNYVSSSIEELFPFLINTDVNYVDSRTGSVAENTDIRFTASVGDAIIRFGGQVFKGIANTDIVIDYPLNKLFKKGFSNNLILRLERVNDPLSTEYDLSFTNGSRVGALLYYRLKF